MDLIQIVEYGLRANGYDGLFVEDRCACKAGDLAPYGCLADGCRPGVLIDIEANEGCRQRIVGPDVPPTDDAGRWERGKSPWHADAFPDEFKDRAPERGDRKTGWLEIDRCGNVIGWVPDGTVIRPNTKGNRPE